MSFMVLYIPKPFIRYYHEIWYRDRLESLDLREKNWLNPGKSSNRDFEFIIMIIFFFYINACYIGFYNNNNYYYCDEPLYFSTECIEVQTMISVDTFFDTLELNYKLTYSQHGVCDLPQVDFLNDNNILLA